MKQVTITRPPMLDMGGRESMNTICTNLTFAGRKIQKILLTSCVAGEGKSTMTARIGISMAERNYKCVLVDADLRRSVVVKRMGIKFENKGTHYGLAHYLAGICEMNDICYQTNITNFDFIPIGRDVSNPITLINTPEFAKMMDTLAKEYDYIFVDTPPIEAVIDAAEIAKCCDGVVFIVEYAKRHRRELQDAVAQMQQSGCQILGCIIDKVTVNTLREKKYYRYSRYYGYGEGDSKSKSDSVYTAEPRQRTNSSGGEVKQS